MEGKRWLKKLPESYIFRDPLLRTTSLSCCCFFPLFLKKFPQSCRSPLESWSCWCCADVDIFFFSFFPFDMFYGSCRIICVERRKNKLGRGKEREREKKERQRFTKFRRRNYTMRVGRGNQKSVQSSQMFYGYARCISLSRQTPAPTIYWAARFQDGSLIYVSVAPWLICKYTEDAVLQLLLARYCAHIISELVNFRYLYTGRAPSLSLFA